MYHYSIYERFFIRFFNLLRKITKNDKYKSYRLGLLDRDMKNNGPEALSIIHEVTHKHNMQYWLTWGSMLAYYREHGFIKGDNDIDLGIWADEINVGFLEDLIERGFEFSSPIVDINHHGFHFAFYFKNVKIDFYSFFINDDKSMIEGFAPLPIDGNWPKSHKINQYVIRRTILPYDGFVEVDYVGVKTYVTRNICDMLKIIYGDDFMTPKPRFKGNVSKNQYKEYDANHYATKIDYNEFVELIRSNKLK